MEDHNCSELHERVAVLETNNEHAMQILDKLDGSIEKLHEKLEENSKQTVKLGAVVSLLGTGIGSVFGAAASFLVTKLLGGNHP